ncbi:subtilisin-like protease 3 [Lingula anatina]|uniref:Subtilisin-like protease 3 n=1 Tax=Lingula anatina TaxID=7574 RepID=A0A1S3K5J9_LINAN|nr:subtilisin-like protease 3 [Lingula anatina]|eukprot:XP_013417704.1 subtilisin-like protease 3 [Lingula anatina]
MKTTFAILVALTVVAVVCGAKNKAGDKPSPGVALPVPEKDEKKIPFKTSEEDDGQEKDPKESGKLEGDEKKQGGIQLDKGLSDDERDHLIRKELSKQGKLVVDEQSGKVRLVKAGAQGEGVPKSYIVTLQENVRNKRVKQMLKRSGLKGKSKRVKFSSKTDFVLIDNVEEEELDSLRDYTNLIKEIEQNNVVHADDCVTSQVSSALWGLDRLDNAPNDDRMVAWGDGTSIDVYIIDTGVLAAHQDFGGRVTLGLNSITGNLDSNDDHGHGTHVAGTAAGTTYGVAKNANIIAVKVLSSSGSGSSAGVIEGVEWVRDRVLQNKKVSIVNMSLGGGYSAASNRAQKELREAGVFSAVAAGNANTDACGKSPASAPDAITVGSTTSSDAKSSFSNWGGCVDIHAPGSSILSAYHTSNTATRTLSGTSMASPHVAGVAAALASTFNAKGWFPETSPTAVDWLESYIKLYAQEGVISGLVSGTTEKMLHMECLNMEEYNN